MMMKTTGIAVVSVRDLYDSLPDEVREYDGTISYSRRRLTEMSGWDAENKKHVKTEVMMPVTTVYDELMKSYAYILDIMLQEAARNDVAEPQIVLGKFSRYGGQHIADWGVTDGAKRYPERSIVYNGGLLFDTENFEQWKKGKKGVQLFSVHT